MIVSKLRDLPLIYECLADNRVDRCAGATNVYTLPTNGSNCDIDLSNDDPFDDTVRRTGPGDEYPNDTKAYCSISIADVGGAGVAEFIDVCSYPSKEPNTAPSDCIEYSTNNFFLEVKKPLILPTDARFLLLQIDGVTDPDANGVGNGGTTGEENRPVGPHTAGEIGFGTTFRRLYFLNVCRD